MKRMLVAIGLGAGLVYFLEPKNGGKRRASVGSKVGNKAGFGGSSQGTTGTSTGAYGVMQQSSTVQHDNDNPDDNTLRDRVESEIFRDAETGRENININVVDGVVEVRGEQPTQDQITALVKRIKAVRGVKGVESYLHLPGTPAPNKEEAINAS